MIHSLAAALSTLLGGEAGVGYARVGGTEGLYPEEAAAVARAIPKRQAEFAAGRRAARAALNTLGVEDRAIPVGDRRAPCWPSDMSGAITHDAGHALAAVLPRALVLGLGIDLTEAKPLPGETRKTILPHAAEQGLDRLEERAAFSAKECLFKALSPLTVPYFGFDAAIVKPDLAGGTFSIDLTCALGSFEADANWVGHVVVLEGMVVTALMIPPSG